MSVFWNTAGQVVGKVAPALATALLGPLGGQAARIICTVLGLAKDSPPEMVAAAVQNATPDQTLALQQADQAFLIRTVEIAAQSDAGQNELNKLEASKTGWFVASWRPALAWVCVVGVAWEFVFGPVVFSVVRLRWPDADMLHLDSTGLMGLLFPLLGLGAYRTIEKINGVAGGEIVPTPRERATAAVPNKSLAYLEPLPVSVPSAPDVGSETPPAPREWQPGQPIVLAPPMPPPIAPVVIIKPDPRAQFFKSIRMVLFSGRLVQSQVEGIEHILDYWNEHYPTGDVRHLAYVMGTTYLETGHTMQPIEEEGRGAGHPYGKTGFWGRGLVQITHEENYAKLSPIVGIDLVTHPEEALTWPVALPVLFEGMMQGLFTGQKLGDFFNATKEDPLGARAIVNGNDRDKDVALYYRAFLGALRMGEVA